MPAAMAVARPVRRAPRWGERESGPRAAGAGDRPPRSIGREKNNRLRRGEGGRALSAAASVLPFLDRSTVNKCE